MKKWIEGTNGNRCSIELFGSEEEAREALASLKDCSRCSDCSDCSDLEVKSPIGTVPPIVPVVADIHKAIYAAVSNPGALDMGSFHKCETTHCRAGWTVVLAGEAGKKLEEFHNTELAAMLIYKASGYEINPCRFYDSDEAAMEDIKELSESSATASAT